MQQGLQQSGMQQQERTFKVKAPNGAVVLVPESEIEEAVSQGGTVVHS
jgi:hypothetical protein